MNLRLAILLSGCLAVGLYFLARGQEVFIPYQPPLSTEFVRISDMTHPGPMFPLRETRAEALRLRDLADQALAAGHDAQAIEALEQALINYSFEAGFYERLDFAYTRTGQWREAAEAMKAAHTVHANFVFPAWHSVSDTHALPHAVEWTEQSGLSQCSHSPSAYLDIAAPGVAIADLTGDGSLEVICLGGEAEPTRIFRQTRHGFSPVSGTALEEYLQSQGVYLFDLTHNGLPDVIVTATGDSKLYLNQGDLHFVPSTLPLPRMWGSAVAAADITGNGHIDLVVGGWVGKEIWSTPKPYHSPYYDDTKPLRERSLPNPDAPLHLLNLNVRYGVPLHILEGDGQGGFTDITAASQVNISATTLNLELIDVNGNGHLDLVVINDSMPARLLLGNGRGQFHDVTHEARFADVRAGMGLAIADFDNDGAWDFIKTHFQGEMHGVFMSDGIRDGIPRYRDGGIQSGVGTPSLPYVGWAAFAWDFDADGREDLLVINGHIRTTPHPMQLFRNRDGRFVDVSGGLPALLQEPLRGRGAAMVDINGDGYDDLLVAQNDGTLRLFKLKPTHDNHWLRIRVRVPDIDALGGVLELEDSSGLIQRRPVRTGSAFFSSQPRDFFFGTGRATPTRLTWRGRTSTRICRDLQPDTILELTASGCEEWSLPETPVWIQGLATNERR